MVCIVHHYNQGLLKLMLQRTYYLSCLRSRYQMKSFLLSHQYNISLDLTSQLSQCNH